MAPKVIREDLVVPYVSIFVCKELILCTNIGMKLGI